jgi:hypothetical protein
MSDVSDKVLNGLVQWLQERPVYAEVLTQMLTLRAEALSEYKTQESFAKAVESDQILSVEEDDIDKIEEEAVAVRKWADELVGFLNQTFNQAGFSFHASPGGTKYKRIVRSDSNSSGTPIEGTASAYCFVNPEGQIFKPKGWQVPANGARAHVIEVLSGHVVPTWHTGWLYLKGRS